MLPIVMPGSDAKTTPCLAVSHAVQCFLGKALYAGEVLKWQCH